jgi:CRP-like cAMP-binding protein
MTLKDRERPQTNSRAQATPPAKSVPGAFLTRLATHESQPTSLKLRQRQRILLTPAQDDLLFAVQSGVVSARIAMATGHAGLITLYFPGDVIAAGALPNFSERTLVAATAAEALRFKSKAIFRLLGADADLLAAYDRQRDRQAARSSLHAAILATLDGPQRLAAFLIEMALEVGVAAGSTIAIELPLTRTEIAQHLALNADTLSRLMSRFKAEGLITQKSRHQIALRNWRAIADMCPVTAALIAIERNRPSPLN